MNFSRLGFIICLGILISGLFACSSSPAPRLYIIEPIVAGESHLKGPAPSIAVAAISIPAYLDRKEIVSRDKRYQISSSKFDRWAEPLEQNIAQVLVENLSFLVPSHRVVAFSWEPTDKFDFTLRVRVIRFGASPDGNVELIASWTLTRSDDTTLTMERSRYVINRSTIDVTGLVAAMSNAVGELSRDIANALATDSE